MASLLDFQIENLQVNISNDRVYANDAVSRKKVAGMIGSKLEPLFSKDGLMRAYPGAVSVRRTLNVQPTPELAAQVSALVARVEASVITPMWARALESPLRADGSLRIKLDATCPITLMHEGVVLGPGTLDDITPGCSLAAYVELSHPWNMLKTDGSSMSGINLNALAIIVEKVPVAEFAW